MYIHTKYTPSLSTRPTHFQLSSSQQSIHVHFETSLIFLSIGSLSMHQQDCVHDTVGPDKPILHLTPKTSSDKMERREKSRNCQGQVTPSFPTNWLPAASTRRDTVEAGQRVI